MNDPSTLAFEIRSPFKNKKHNYKPSIISIWHVDPNIRGDDDSCGWFPRSRHGNKDVLKKIERRFEEDWDRVFKMDEFSQTRHLGFFNPNGTPNMSVNSIVLNLVFLAVCEHFREPGMNNWKKSRNFMQDNLFDILFFAANPIDSLRNSIVGTFGIENRKERIETMASIIYGWVLRQTRPWYKHPRWHFWHWKVDIHAVSSFKRWAFSKCCKCGKKFPWGYSPTSSNWDYDGPKWFIGEKDVYHSNCNDLKDSGMGCVRKG